MQGAAPVEDEVEAEAEAEAEVAVEVAVRLQEFQQHRGGQLVIVLHCLSIVELGSPSAVVVHMARYKNPRIWMGLLHLAGLEWLTAGRVPQTPEWVKVVPGNL